MTLMLLEWVITATFLILVVLGLRAALGKRISARLRYALWAVVLVRLLVPVQLFTSPLAGTWVVTETRTEQNVYTPVSRGEQFHPDGPTIVLDTKGEVDNGPVLSAPSAPTLPDAPAVPEPPAAPDLTKAPAWLGWIWLGGSLAAALVMLGSNLRFARRLRRCRARLDGADCPLPVYAAVGLPSPCLFGVLRPAVYVTPETTADAAMLRHVTAHEYTHFRQGDHIWSFLRCAALAVHWWNPLVWLAVKLSRRDGELSCDEGALKRLGDGERAAYGNTLLALVTAKPRPGDLLCFATTMAGDKKSLRERITRIAQAPKRWLWAAVAVVLVTALACLCAFGQKAADDPEPDPTVEPSAEPSESPSGDPLYRVTGFEAKLYNVEIAFDPTEVKLPSHVPEDVLERACLWVSSQFDWDAPGGVMTGTWKEYNKETGEWETKGDPDIRAEFDRARISAMDGPWPYSYGNAEYSVWSINYEYHTTTPDVVKEGKFLHMAAGRYLDGDGWMGPTYPNGTYLIFKNNSDGSHSYAGAMYNSVHEPMDPDSEEFAMGIEAVLFPEPERGEPPEDAFAPGSTRTHMFYEPDLNRNGIPETVVTEDIYGTPEDYGNKDAIIGARIGVFEDGELIWWDEGYTSHAGWNAIFSCTVDGEEYLLRYNPMMYGGLCEYSYKLFTLEGSRETAVEQDYVFFDANLGTYVFTGEFDPEAIGAFMERVNWLLGQSTICMITHQDLIGSFRADNEPGLRDNLWWLGGREPMFVRDESKSLTENLRAFRDAFVGGELAPFRRVLLGSEELVTEWDMQLTRQTLAAYMDEKFADIERFAVVTVPDGETVVMLELSSRANGAEGMMYLYQQSGRVYGTEPAYMGADVSHARLSEVKADGTRVIYDSPGMDGEVLVVNTEIGSFEVVTAHTQDGLLSTAAEYYADGEPATEEEYRAALEREAGKPNAVWYDFTEESVHAVFG